jgi:tRNA U34 5-methylaminomethyl-2-thiouridine-forming methyltransferase MnmC
LQRKIITTADGSKTIHLVEWDEHYHSIHGAIQEANHVFIKHGLLFFVENSKISSVTSSDSQTSEEKLSQGSKEVTILEIGFGTGLNTFITLLEAQKLNVAVTYVGVEAFPISSDEIEAMNYSEQLDENRTKDFENIHQVSWEEKHRITSGFLLTKQKKYFADIDDQEQFDLIYFDAFGARVQPELWTEAIFQKMYNTLRPNGILVTYSAKGSVRRAMIAVGFTVERLPGPPGKREMLRATKHST